MPDTDLIRRAQDGDEAALSALVRTYLPNAFSLAARLAGDRALAEDIAQEAFVKAWRHLGRFDAEKPFLPWLLAIVRNTALDHLRKRRALPFSSLAQSSDDGSVLSFEDTLADDAPLPDALFARAALGEEVAGALALLPERDRTVLALRYENGLPFEDIAQVMSAPMNTVKSWHRRALARLRTLLPDAPESGYDA